MKKEINKDVLKDLQRRYVKNVNEILGILSRKDMDINEIQKLSGEINIIKDILNEYNIAIQMEMNINDSIPEIRYLNGYQR